MKLVPKDAVLAEIERRIKILQKNPYENHKTICHLDSLKQSYNTLKVKEVDLEKEIMRYTMSKELYEADSVIKAVAEHFFELGLKAQKGE